MASKGWSLREVRISNLFHGFIREIQQLREDSIPDDLFPVFVSFYYFDEHFALCPNSYHVDSHKLMITKKDYSASSVFGNISLDSTLEDVHCWLFEIYVSSQGAVCIGITDSSDNDEKRLCFGSRDTNNYFNVFREHNSPKSVSNRFRKTKDLNNGLRTKIVRMELNLKEKQLTFYQGEHGDIPTGVRNIKYGEDIQYKMGVMCRWSNLKVHLLKYEVKNDADD